MADKPQDIRRNSRLIEGKTRPAVNPSHQQSLQTYQTALQLMQEGKFEKARQHFDKLVDGGPPELLERTRVYLNVCDSKIKQAPRVFHTPGERYDYAISLLNTGDYEEARDHFESIVREHTDADYAYYGLAALESITGQVEESLANLSRAIQLNPRNRIQARTDTDFQDMIDDPRFTELLYPELL